MAPRSPFLSCSPSAIAERSSGSLQRYAHVLYIGARVDSNTRTGSMFVPAARTRPDVAGRRQSSPCVSVRRLTPERASSTSQPSDEQPVNEFTTGCFARRTPPFSQAHVFIISSIFLALPILPILSFYSPRSSPPHRPASSRLCCMSCSPLLNPSLVTDHVFPFSLQPTLHQK